MTKQQRRAASRAQRLEVVEDLPLHRDVERGRGLVGDEEIGLAGQCDRDQHALSHAAGELVRVLPDPTCSVRDADLAHQLHRAGFRLRCHVAIPCACRVSAICWPTRVTGLRFDIGSCGISPTCRPRSSRSRRSLSPGDVLTTERHRTPR